MKKIHLLFAFFALSLASCSDFDDVALWNKTHDVDSRLTTLEQLCNQMNTNISSLQTIVTALQNNDYVKSVTPLIQSGKEVGYVLVFSKGHSATIYHGKDGTNGTNGQDGSDGQNGKDGQNGTDGKDGATPVLGVKKDADGIYYWTLNGEWLTDGGNKVKAQGTDGKNGTNGADGNDGADGSDGTNGNDGQDGTNGTDGITPKLKIEGGYWHVSYNNGDSWTQLSKATGADGQDGKDGQNGSDGKDGSDGDAMFSNVDYTTSEDYVTLTLFDGTVIKLPTWKAFAALQAACNEMNTNISSLQTIVTALQGNDYIKSVAPFMQDGKEVGYTITFNTGAPITIYHGKDGKDGTNGQDGNDGTNGATPVIGVKKDADNIYYWTLNGEWLKDGGGNKIKAQGTDGANGSDGNDGADGSDGTNGSNGQDGVTPKLKIDGGYWHISYDNGSSWTQLGKATGENGQDGTNGNDGQDGDSMFSNVDYSSSTDYVTFTLSDGTTITVAKYKDLTITFNQQTAIPIRAGEPLTVTYTIVGGGANPSVESITSDGWKAVVTPASATTGSIIITRPKIETTATKVVVFVSDGKGRTTMTTISFVLSDELYIPDPRFNAFLLQTCDMNGDGKLKQDDVIAWNETRTAANASWWCIRMNIQSLEGIEHFVALKELFCYDNQLTSLDLSKNTALTYVSCEGNQLTSLIIGNNTALERLYLDDGQLTSLDVTACTALWELYCPNNQLTSLDVSKNTALLGLDCSGNQLTSLDVSKTKLNVWAAPLCCASMPTLETLYLKTGWEIEKINKNRSTTHIPPQTEILYKD